METINVVAVPLPAMDVAPPQLGKGEREYRAFNRLLLQLLPTYAGKFVAIHGEQVVDSDADDIALILRVHSRYGYVPMHVGLVTDSAQVPVRVPHYRIG